MKKIVYTNTPGNVQKKPYPSFKAIAAISCIIAIMAAVKVLYKPNETLEDVAAMANATVTEKESTDKESDTLPSAVQTSTVYVSSLDYTKTERKIYYFPLKGEISSAFAERDDPFGSTDTEFHQGIDIVPYNDSTVNAFSDGEVSMAGYDTSYGNYIKISHENGLETLYAHCSDLFVNKGDTVRAGQPIAMPGSTGRSTGVHLHFEIRHNGACIDPMGYLA
ncbi:MAG: M23 family metallopeptidase [Ruminococcaceae bacterium]|nr:M23 family metallopeptidase [Oscillospiraceae bacterium]